MTVVVEAVMRGGKVVPLDAKKVEKWEAAHKNCEVFDLILDDGASTANTPLARKFHAIRDEYAALNGYDNEHAKTELKWLHGVYTKPDSIPTGRDGRIMEYHGERLWFLSIRDYETEELQRLVNGADLVLQEASV